VTDITVYATKNEEVIAVYKQAMVEFAEWRERMLAWQKENDRGVSTTRYSYRLRLVGLEAKGDLIPAGWAKYDKYPYLVPARGVAGEPAQEWLNRNQPPDSAIDVLARAFHAPTTIINEATSRMMTPGYSLLGDTLYMVWSGKDIAVDARHFQRVQPSEYYAARGE
jgi:hypothetical protein